MLTSMAAITPKRMDAGSRTKDRQLQQWSGTRDAASKLVCDERCVAATYVGSVKTTRYDRQATNPAAVHLSPIFGRGKT